MRTQRRTGSCRLPIISLASLTPMVAVAAATLGSHFSHLPVGRRQRRYPSDNEAAGRALRMRLTNPSRVLAGPAPAQNRTRVGGEREGAQVERLPCARRA